MANIRIERVPISTFNLGLLGFDHLQLAFEQDSLTSTPIPQGEWFVMEGLRVDIGTRVVLGAFGETGLFNIKIANNATSEEEVEAKIGTPEDRGSRIINVLDPQATWTQMALHAANIKDQGYDYRTYGGQGSLLPTLNSTSFIASVLYSAGVDIAVNLPRNLRLSPGMETLLGGNGDDHLRIQSQFTAVYGGFGQDLLQGLDDVTRIDRLYGGADNDLLSWSSGKNYLHGGDSSWTYTEDGFDSVNYSGSGGAHIEFVRGWVEHQTPQYQAFTTTSIDYLLSIERLIWNDASSDHITTGPGVELIETPLSLYLGSEGASLGPDQGDIVDFSATKTALTINRATDTAHWVTAEGQQGKGGLWIASAEWLVASSGDDKIYAGEAVRGVEGGLGADFIDARLAEAFSGKSPDGYDIELWGGDGADTLITGGGTTFASGDEGGDTIVISSMTTGEKATEIVIENADGSDKLYIPYNYFNESSGGYEGSQLLQITGAVGRFQDMVENGWETYFETRLQADVWTNPDEIAGLINFAGLIGFRMEGSDLIISLIKGERVYENVVIDDIGTTELRALNIILPETETIVRVVDFQPGDLGLQFLDPGELIEVDLGGNTYAGWTNWDAAVRQLNVPMLDPFADRPAAPSIDPNDPDNAPEPPARQIGTDDADLIALSVPTRVDAGDGDDTITSTGDHDDTIDGGTGDDTMAGGEGDDHYYVDRAGDVVIEEAGAGIDTIITSISLALTTNVENLTLADGAVSGTGNELANRLVGNAGANTLTGLAGDDTLFGDLGDDILMGGDGSDYYTYVRGNGNDTILDNGTDPDDVDTLRFFQDITPEDISAVRLSAASTDMLLVIRGGGQITLADAYAGDGMPIEQILFDNGDVWTTADILALAEAAALVDAPPPDATNDEGLFWGTSNTVLPASVLLRNDTDQGGSPLSIIGVSEVSVGSATVTPEGDITFDLPPGYEGEVRFRYTVTNASGATASAAATILMVTNTAPTLTQPLPDQIATIGEAWSLGLPGDLFTDADGDLISYFASLEDGSELPSWLTFDTATASFTGTPPEGTNGPIAIRLQAYDGFSVSQATFTLDVSQGTSDPDQVFISGIGSDVLTGGSGNDTFLVIGNLGGLDTFIGGAGSDRIIGSMWNDTIGLANTANNLDGIEFIDGGMGYDRIVLTGGNDSIDLSQIVVEGVELIDAGAGNDIVIGSAGNDTIRGNAGDDTLLGGAGNDTFTILGNPEGFDTFDGGSGTDTIQASPWNDTLGLANVAGNLNGIELIDMGDGTDRIVLTAGNDALDLSAITVLGVELVDGGAGNDSIIGSASNDTIRGNAGDDTIVGGAGDDTFTVLGNAEGHDTFDGGTGFDRILGSEWNDTLALANTAGNLVGIEAIDLGGGSDKIVLTSGNDTLDLSGMIVSGVELIDAGAGNDIITASAADDILRGGTGSDTFTFRDGFGKDTVQDFEIGSGGVHDIIDLSDHGFTDYSALLAASSEVAGDTVITIDATQQLTLTGVSLQQLTTDHFLLA